MASKSEVEEYYNKTWRDLDEKGLSKPNNRHLIIMDKLKTHGLKPDSNVLEIGCGIGTLSNLLSVYCKKGHITAVDISPETIKLAQYKFQNRRNLKFEVSDMSDWKHDNKFDIIVLPDVLEHIPYEQHNNLFEKLKSVCHVKTRILINIPHPIALEELRRTQKELLQIIDLPVHLDILCKSVYNIGYYINSVESYKVGFDQEDYQFICTINKDDIHPYKASSKIYQLFQFLKYKTRSLTR